MSPRPKIVVVGTTDVDARLELIHSLPDDYEISVLGSSEALRDDFSRARIEYQTYWLTRRANPVSDFLSLLQLWFIFRGLKPALVHAFDTKPSVLARLAARLAGVPVIIGTLPGLGTLYTQNGLITRFLKLVYKVLQRAAAHVSDVTIFQNEDDARQLVTEKIVSPGKTTVIAGSGVATARFSHSSIPETTREMLRQELGIGHQIVVTMVSRIIRSKGVLEFMSAAQEARALHPELHFVLVGPEDPDSLDRLSPVEVEQLKQAVTWPGERDDIPAILAVSDIFVLPSAYREGIPRVLLEALSMGLPIITTDSPGCREAVWEGRNGFLIDSGDAPGLRTAVVRLAEDAAMRKLFGEFSRRMAVEHFDLRVIAGQTDALYRRLLYSKTGWVAAAQPSAPPRCLVGSHSGSAPRES